MIQFMAYKNDGPDFDKWDSAELGRAIQTAMNVLYENRGRGISCDMTIGSLQIRFRQVDKEVWDIKLLKVGPEPIMKVLR